MGLRDEKLNYSGWQRPTFDQHQFAEKRLRAVFRESRITFSDFNTMHVVRRGGTQERRLATPEWAVNDELLRLVIVRFVEKRVYMSHPDTSLSLRERLDLAMREGQRRAVGLQANLEALLDRHEAARKESRPRAELKKIEIEIMNLDTMLVMSTKLPEIIAAIVYGYHRRGLDSVTIAGELKLKPPHIRQVLRRLCRVWDELQNPKARVRPSGKRKKLNDAVPSATPPAREGNP